MHPSLSNLEKNLTKRVSKGIIRVSLGNVKLLHLVRQRPLSFMSKTNTQVDVAQLVRLLDGDHVDMGSTPTFHNGIKLIKRIYME